MEGGCIGHCVAVREGSLGVESGVVSCGCCVGGITRYVTREGSPVGIEEGFKCRERSRFSLVLWVS